MAKEVDPFAVVRTTDVFVSYSRRDSEWIPKVLAMLEAEGLTAWVDRDGLHAGESFNEEIRRAIEAAPAFVQLLSPQSAASKYCRAELEYAVAMGKRIVPVVVESVASGELHPAVSSLHWFDLRTSDEETASREIAAAVQDHWSWLRDGTRLLLRARRWVEAGEVPSGLLRGTELREALTWLSDVPPGLDERPTDLHRRFVDRSRRQRARRRFIAVASTVGLLLLAAVTAWWSASSYVINRVDTAVDRLDDPVAREERVADAQKELASAERLCAAALRTFSGCPNVELVQAKSHLLAGELDAALDWSSRALVQTALEGAPPAEVEAIARQVHSTALTLRAETLSKTDREAAYLEALEHQDRAQALLENLDTVGTRCWTTTSVFALLGLGRVSEAREALEPLATCAVWDRSLAWSLVTMCEGGDHREHLAEYFVAVGTKSPHWGMHESLYRGVADRCSR